MVGFSTEWEEQKTLKQDQFDIQGKTNVSGFWTINCKYKDEKDMTGELDTIG